MAPNHNCTTGIYCESPGVECLVLGMYLLLHVKVDGSACLMRQVVILCVDYTLQSSSNKYSVH